MCSLVCVCVCDFTSNSAMCLPSYCWLFSAAASLLLMKGLLSLGLLSPGRNKHRHDFFYHTSLKQTENQSREQTAEETLPQNGLASCNYCSLVIQHNRKRLSFTKERRLFIPRVSSEDRTWANGSWICLMFSVLLSIWRAERSRVYILSLKADNTSWGRS